MISVLVLVLHSLVSVLALVPLRSDLINTSTINEQLTYDVPRDRRRCCWALATCRAACSPPCLAHLHRQTDKRTITHRHFLFIDFKAVPD